MNNETQQEHSPGPPPPQPPPPLSTQSSVRAALCAIIPGIGAVYNREYVKAVVHFTVFASLAVIADAEPIFGLAAFSYYVYTIIDAYRSAEAISRRGRPSEDAGENINLPFWGGVLVVLGVIFLLDNLGAIRLRSVVEFWPLILIFLGGYLILNYLKGNSSRARIPPGRASVPGTDERSSATYQEPSMPAARSESVTTPTPPGSDNQRDG